MRGIEHFGFIEVMKIEDLTGGGHY